MAEKEQDRTEQTEVRKAAEDAAKDAEQEKIKAQDEAEAAQEDAGAKNSDEDAAEESLKAAEQAESVVRDQLLRLQADFENYKKRTQKEKSEIYAFAMESLMTKLLPVIDNLERAESAADGENMDNYQAGVQMVFKELMNVLNGEGLSEIEALGKPFDPNFHHGVAVGEDADKADQEVLEVFQKGYTFKDKVIRAAMVKVNQI